MVWSLLERRRIWGERGAIEGSTSLMRQKMRREIRNEKSRLVDEKMV